MLELIKESGRRIGGAAVSCSPDHRDRTAAWIEEEPEFARAQAGYEANWWGLDEVEVAAADLEQPSYYSDEVWAAVLFFVEDADAYDRDRFIDLFLEYELSRCD